MNYNVRKPCISLPAGIHVTKVTNTSHRTRIINNLNRGVIRFNQLLEVAKSISSSRYTPGTLSFHLHIYTYIYIYMNST